MRRQNWKVEKRFIKVSDCVTAEWVLMARIKLKCKCWPTPAKLGVAERNLDFYLSSGGFLIWDTNYFLHCSNCSIWCASSFEDMQRNEGSKVRRKCPRKVVQLDSSRLQSFYSASDNLTPWKCKPSARCFRSRVLFTLYIRPSQWETLAAQCGSGSITSPTRRVFETWGGIGRNMNPCYTSAVMMESTASLLLGLKMLNPIIYWRETRWCCWAKVTRNWCDTRCIPPRQTHTVQTSFEFLLGKTSSGGR